MTATVIPVQMDAALAEMLVMVSTRWTEPLWSEFMRYESVNIEHRMATRDRYEETNAYWLDSSPSSLILFTSYIAAHGWEFCVLWDTAFPEDQGFLVLTDWQAR